MQKKRQHVEDSHQEALIEWFYRQYPKELIFCIPNQLVRSCEQAIIMARRGLVTGMPDVCVVASRAGFHGLFIELKQPKLKNTPKGGVSEAQFKVIRHLNNRGYLAIICYGWDEARLVVQRYMND